MNQRATNSTTNALLKSILDGPLLIGDLPESKSFCRSKLELATNVLDLNLNQKLGHLFEDALASLILASDRLELLEQNLQLRDEHLKTVGEVDFLLKENATPTLIHLELATKFYLAVATGDGIALPGPDARDNYYRKLARMRDHQLGLSVKFRSCLPLKYKDAAIESQQLVFGCLFDHIDASESFTPEFVLDKCRRGKWLHQQDCDRFFPVGSKFEIIPKSLWPVPFDFLNGIVLEPWTPQQQVDRCLMVRVNGGSTPIFVAPKNYPNQT